MNIVFIKKLDVHKLQGLHKCAVFFAFMNKIDEESMLKEAGQRKILLCQVGVVDFYKLKLYYDKHPELRKEIKFGR